MSILLDTNVVSEARQAKPDQRVLAEIGRHDPQTLYFSSVGFGELTFGIARMPDGKRKRDYETWLEHVRQAYGDRILPFDAEAARIWGELLARCEDEGNKIPLEDGQIAATALRFGMKVMTRNVKHFENSGVDVINPWE